MIFSDRLFFCGLLNYCSTKPYTVRVPAYPLSTKAPKRLSKKGVETAGKEKSLLRKMAANRLVWRRGRDSNPREIALKLISSQPRYDHFDTSPCIILVHRPCVEVKAKCRKTVEIDKTLNFQSPANPQKLKDFWQYQGP